MKFSTLAIFIASIASTLAADDDWVTYTKKLSYTTIDVTKYVGTTPLTGSEYTTKTITVTDASGNILYTELATGRVAAADATTASESSTSEETSSAAATAESSSVEETTSVESSSAVAESSEAVETTVESSVAASSATSSQSSAAEVSTFEGAANIAGLSFGALAVGAAALLI